MGKYGKNPYPRRYGGGTRALETELIALLDALEPGWDPAVETESYAELVAYARTIATIWAVNGRLRNQMIPSKMLENLPVWEEILRTPASKEDSLQTRRGRVAAKLLGYAGNSIANIIAVITAVAGLNFVELRIPDAAHTWVYWPGVNPGPPGFEWSSNRATITIVLVQRTLAINDFRNLIENVLQAVKAMCASWLTMVVGVDDPTTGQFIADVGICDLTLLEA